MRVRIHRGAHEIGGSCVEVEAGGQRVVLDVGRPLDAEQGTPVPLPEVVGFDAHNPGLLGVVITHAHQDHWGLADQLPEGTPIYMGQATAAILREAAFWTTGFTGDVAGYLRHRTPFELGPFTITPFLNDHSAFDAYSLLVQAEGRSLFYTGDIRGHGRKSGIFEELLRKPPSPVDVLLMEGTNIRPVEAAAESEAIDDDEFPDPQTESDLENIAVEVMRDTVGMVLLTFSGQNIDRLVTFYRAAKKSGRTLVLDLYTARVAMATGNSNIPRPGPEWPDVKVYVPFWQRLKVLKSAKFSLVSNMKPYRIYDQELAANPSKFAVKFSLGAGRSLGNAGCLPGATLLYSIWSGYLKDSDDKLAPFLAQHGIPMALVHTSGHASVSDLQRLCRALKPERVVPIHTLAGGRFEDLFDNVTPQPDGQWWTV